MRQLRVVAFVAVLFLLPLAALASEYKPVAEFPQGKQTDAFASAFLSGFNLGNAVERSYSAPLAQVWLAAKRAAEDLEKAGRREIATVNERTNRVQVGKISQDAAAGLGTGGWMDEIVIEATKVSDIETKVVVSRVVVQPILKKARSGYDRQLRSAKSSGDIESWVHTRLERELAAIAAEPQPPVVAKFEEAKPEPAPAAGATSPEAQLQRLGDLKAKGLISEEEYQAMRKKVLEAALGLPK